MIYGLVLRIRHLLYDKGWKKSFSAPVPTVCVGNITVGGTGKTPHVELLLRLLLAAGKQPAVLSRGYKRKLKGFQLLPADGTAALYGDEPVQIAHKFPEVPVAVDKDRVHGCGQLAAKASCIVLDDAFQYRRLRATLNIVLVDYNRPVFKDCLLPWGRLRDLPGRLKAAQVVIVTKCPAELSAQEREAWQKDLHLSPEQQLFFTTLQYGTPLPVFPEADAHYLYAKQCTVLTGIANDAPLRSYLSDTYKIGQHLQFPDHHAYSKADLRTIGRAIQASATSCLFTTEKDAQRLRDCKNVPQSIRERLFYIPVEAAFLTPEEQEAFCRLLTSTIRSERK
ncbi:MAG: tetraacyldisaccharide 4'-kinase [Bacteroidales bacterium]|nr:tetraacyldisaccharide 4'-kinase [Bacteroidales bacterium]